MIIFDLSFPFIESVGIQKMESQAPLIGSAPIHDYCEVYLFSNRKFYKRQNTEISGFDHCVKGKDSHVSSVEEQRLLKLSGICAAVTLVINIVSAFL